MRVEVEDNGGAWAPRRDTDPDTCGRGLAVVAGLAGDWGITPRASAATARTAWFVIGLP